MRKHVAITCLCILCAGCGFLRDPTFSSHYVDTCVPNDEAMILTTWPFHLAMITGCAVLDQGVTTLTTLGPAALDTYDYLLLEVDDNNIMLERTIFIPKIIASPIIFAGSYTVRWLLPFANDNRPFKSKE